MITSQDIVEWADRKACEILLPVLIRRLVHETATDIKKCDFPGGDGAQIGGWDGITEFGTGNAWTPVGRAGWEMGKQKDIKGKADDDYEKRLDLPQAERKAMTFVFVTPRRWRGHTERSGPEAWLKARRAANDWASVQVIDADALEQWLEQAPATRQWFAEVLGRHVDGLISPDRAWDQWAAPTTPHLTPALFEEPIRRADAALTTFFSQPPVKPLIVTADRREEAVALIAAILQTPAFAQEADRAVIVSGEAALTRIMAEPPALVVIADRTLETKLASLPQKTRVIVATSRSEHDDATDVLLDPLSPEAFREAVEGLTGDHEEANRWARESGKSVTILRRRLTPLNRRPAWSSDPALASRLTVFALAGGWVSPDRKAADEALLVRLGRRSAADLDLDFQQFASIEDPPVFTIAGVRSVTSRIDAFEAVRPWLTRDDLERYLAEFSAILEDADPSLELPEDERWMASIQGKTRALSGRLRRSLLETAILLDMQGADIRRRLHVDVSARIGAALRQALPPGAPKRWLDMRDSLRILAEAAPDAFLDCLENDLDSDAPGVFALIKPVSSSPTSENLRTELMWALELLAWHPRRFGRVAAILARLSRTKLKDNHVNKPAHSLGGLFRSWLPQTASPLDRRIAVLRTLCRTEPDVLWPTLTGLFDIGPSIAFPSARPRWREDALMAVRPTVEDCEAMLQAALDLALTWPHHTPETLGDLIKASPRFEQGDQTRLWSAIEAWSVDQPESSRSILADRIRDHLLTIRAFGRHDNLDYARAREVQQALSPDDPVLRNAHLFAKDWIQLEADENDTAKPDRREQDRLIKERRSAALQELISAEGADGLVRLIAGVDGLRSIGWTLSDAGLGDNIEAEIACALLRSDLPEAKVDTVMTNLLAALPAESRIALLDEMTATFPDQISRVLMWVAPGEEVRARLADLPEDQARLYWLGVQVWTPTLPPDLQRWFVENLLAVDRPRTAFQAVHLDMETVSTDLLILMLRSMVQVDRETDITSFPDAYDIAAALSRLDADATVPLESIAQLEFLYLDALTDHSERGPAALHRVMASSPEDFVQMIGFVYRRDDGAERLDPPSERDGLIAQQAYTLLRHLNARPSTPIDGPYDPARLAAFIAEVRERAAAIGRTESAEAELGGWFARSAPFTTEHWPPPEICTVLEDPSAEALRRAYSLALRNARGIVTKSYYGGGDQERALGARFRTAAHPLAETWPRVSRMLEGIAMQYEKEGEENDDDASLRKRTDF